MAKVMAVLPATVVGATSSGAIALQTRHIVAGARKPMLPVSLETLHTPTDVTDADSGIGQEMQIPLAPISVDGLGNGWPDAMQQDMEALQTFQTLPDNGQPVYSHINPSGDSLERLGNLQKEILVDMDLAKTCKTAADCAQLSLPTELAYNSSFLVGRMLEHSKTLLGIMDSFDSILPASSCPSNPDHFPATQTCTGSLHCDVPTTFSLFSCYVCLIRIYRTIFSCIHDSMPVLLSLQQPLPQLFPGINLAGFSLESRLDLQVQILVQVSEDMLAKLEAKLGVSEGATAGQGVSETTGSANMLRMMLQEEAMEEPPLHEPRGPCEPLRTILSDLKRMINVNNAK
ncbi:hypothetical protein AYO21_08096 [Fonsecaea monophora]|uniref:Aflatoxin regulatory protein domain-containing protein n=1 Tax=Fonsecaea monophora TaxID=254056 RepID=A0A177F0C2_9EURO|nr:hypothetical protein AYO21_08096 [Fonsecaea monophora]OAG37733.1 hypothetical protein AYO21_08096 [Fonsecaea monophora]